MEHAGLIDWRKLNAGPELDRYVYETLGWTKISQVYISWADWIGLPPNSTSYEYLPRISTDANVPLFANWRDTSEAFGDLELHQYGSSFYGRYTIPTSSSLKDQNLTLESADTLALTRVRAWLGFQDHLHFRSFDAEADPLEKVYTGFEKVRTPHV